MKEHENDENTTVALLARIYGEGMIPQRIGDWVNGFVGKSKTLNQIDLKKKVMIRRIKKNQKEDTEDIIPLPSSLIEFIKKRGIKGELFPNMSGTQIDNLIKKTYGDKKAMPHYWRSYYTVNVLPTLDEEHLKEALMIMDHSIQVNQAHYNKAEATPIVKALIKKK